MSAIEWLEAYTLNLVVQDSLAADPTLSGVL